MRALKTWRVAFAGAAMVTAILLPTHAATQKKTDAERMVGTWLVADAKFGGEEFPSALKDLIRVTFTKAGKMTFALLEKTEDIEYALPEDGKIDWKRGKNEPGIYKFDGDDRLTICLNGDGRPTEFVAGDKGSRQVLLVLRRARPDDEKPSPEAIAKAKGELAKIRDAAERTTSMNNLKQIGLAFHNYHDLYKQFPPAYFGKDGKPLLSWRVALLPFINERPLFNEFQFDQPWDSERNKKLIARMPKLYQPVGEGKKHEGHTYYQVFTGRNTVFDGTKSMSLAVIANSDGTSNTLLVVEAKNSVVWTKPDDLEMPAADAKTLPVGGLFKDRWHALFCDGSVSTFANDMPIKTLRALITPAGNELPDFEKYLK